MTMRQDQNDADWPARPWIMAAIGAVGGLIVHLLVDGVSDADLPVWKQAATAFTIIAVLSFLLTVEPRRWQWALAFALGWGAVVALVGWFTAQYNHHGEIAEFPFLSGLLAVIVAAPLFQTVRDEGVWRFPYPRLHRHAWTDAVLGAASLAFVGISFLMLLLIAQLFELIGITAIKDLLEESWFGWMLAGFAFGAAVGLLRERDALVGTLQRLVTVVLSVLAPVLAVALVAFLASVPFTGLGKLWSSLIPATPLMLVAGAGAILLANAVIGDGDEEGTTSKVLRVASLALVLTLLPLAIIAAVSLAQRIGQYGWTPERIWGVVAVLVALVYGLAGWWAVAKGRLEFDTVLRPLQTRMAIGLCGLALVLALPIVDFGAISARSQLARLESGAVKVDEFDWAAMSFDFGPAGRNRLQKIADSGALDQRALAAVALKGANRWKVAASAEARRAGREAESRLRLATPDIVLTDELREAIGMVSACSEPRDSCVLMRTGPDQYVLISAIGKDRDVSSKLIDLAESRKEPGKLVIGREMPPIKGIDLATARLELREVKQRQLLVNGKPVGKPFD